MPLLTTSQRCFAGSILADFFNHQHAKGVLRKRQIADLLALRLNRVVRDCGLIRLADLSAADLWEKWLSTRQPEGHGGRHSKRLFREACMTFANWCVRNRRLFGQSVCRSVEKPTPRLDQRRKRRSLTEAELTRLLT